MKLFVDRKIRKMAHNEELEAPDKFVDTIDKTLKDLPEDNKKIKIKTMWNYALNWVATFAIAIFVLLPNLNPKIAYAMQEIPILGNVVKVITIRNYFEKEGSSELNIEVPNIKNQDNSQSNANDFINADVDKLTKEVMDRFYEDKDKDNHLSIETKSDVIQNDENWFTLKITATEVAGSSNTYYKFYHIDKRQDKIVSLSDLFSDNGYKDAISNDIKRQMDIQMKEDENIDYWTDEEFEDWSFTSIDDDQNFYFSKDGNIVIVFDKYEVGPGYMGTPEFEVDKSVYEKFLKNN